MAFIIKPLGVGNIAVNTTTDLYTVPAGGSAIISSVRLTNNSDGNSAQVNLLVDPSGAAGEVRVSRKDYPLAVGGMMVMEDELTLGQGDKLRAQVNGTSPTIHYVVNGVEGA